MKHGYWLMFIFCFPQKSRNDRRGMDALSNTFELLLLLHNTSMF